VSGGGNPPENLTAKGNYYVRPSGKKAHLGLDQAAKMWPTPRASANENRQTKPTPSQLAGRHGMNLATKAAMWPTPMASDGCKPSGGNRRSADLTHVAGMWPTPLARDWKGTNSSEHVKQQPPERNHMDQLANFAVYSRQALTISEDGASISDQRRSLNPAFVEALMGWPVGWTGFGFAATEWSPWLQRMRSEFLRLGSVIMDDGVAKMVVCKKVV
jgi:hypothetical protein